MNRLIDDIGDPRNGRTILCVGGIHGSEPAGVHAAERVCAHLRDHDLTPRGRLVAARGNLGALAAGRRYLDVDLNRIWAPDALAEILVDGDGTDGEPREYAEARALHDLVTATTAAATGPVCFLDLHTTSSPGMPFVWSIDSVGVGDLLDAIGLPVVHDGQGRISGTAGQYVAGGGHEVITAEGGQHADPRAIDHHEALLWIALVERGLLGREEVATKFDAAKDLLRRVRGDAPDMAEIVYHHKITDDDGFRMRPGYENFRRVEPGEILADDGRGPVAAPVGGRILMPLYLPPCDDGFMIVEAAAAGSPNGGR